MEEAEGIVTMLNGPPLELGTTVMDFCQMSPMDLWQLLYAVLSAILPPQRVDETQDSKNSWMMELLRVLNYRPNIDGITLREGIVNGSVGVIYPLLPWLLSQMTMLQKRAYLARFLIDVEIPAELLLEEDMNLLHAQYNGIREQFKDTHRHLDSVRQIERNPTQVKGQVQELETERDHLQSKIVKVKRKLQDVEKVEAMLEVVGQLKSLRLEEATLAETWKDQNQALADSLGKHQKATSQLHQVQVLAAGANNPAFLEKIAQGNSILHYNAEKKLPKEVKKKQLHLRALQEVLGNNSDGLAGIQAKLLAVNEELRSLKKNNGIEKVQQTDQALKGAAFEWQEVQMGAVVATQLPEAYDKLETLTLRRDQLLDIIDQKTAAIEEVKATVRRGEDFKQYVDQLRMKSATYKKMKKEIDDLEAEHGGLVKTQEFLEQQLSSALEHLGQDRILPSGDDGHADSQNSIQKLKELIAEVNSLADEKRSKLTPQVNELERLRVELHELELEHEDKSKHYSEVHSLFERKVRNLEADISACSKELEIERNALNNNAAAIEKLQASVVELNTENQDGLVSKKLSCKIEQQEELMTSLHQKLQKLKEMEQSNLDQRAMMKDLLTLLAAKLSMYSSGSKPAIFSTAPSFETVDK
ncbi:unnamed protein product [Calypogeia fissa]